MKIYESEKSLAHLIGIKTTAKLNVPIKPTDSKVDLFIENLNKIKRNGCGDTKIGQAIAKLSDEPHPDLMYGSAILVSTVVNDNDDVFLPEETWAARYTPINTPYNNEHEEEDIIGHIIAARPLDSEGKEITSTEPPPYFDIEVDFVVYKGIFPAIATEISEKGPKGEKFVSMEAKFSEFDYGLIDDKNQLKIYARNDKTAFLTKYLKAYGGEGKYEKKRIARILRGFRFSGMGNVDVPANPASEYTKLENYEFAAANNQLTNDAKVAIHVIKGKVMKIENLDQANSVIANLEAELEKFRNKEGENLVTKVQTLETENKTLASQLQTEKSKAEMAADEVETAKKKAKDKEEEADKAKKDKEKAEADLQSLKNDLKANERVAQLKGIGVEVPDDKKEVYAKMDDAAFASMVEFAKKIKEGSTGGTDAAAVAAAEAKAKEELNKAQANQAPDVTKTAGDQTSEDDKLQKTAAKLAAALSKSKNRNSGASKSNKTE